MWSFDDVAVILNSPWKDCSVLGLCLVLSAESCCKDDMEWHGKFLNGILLTHQLHDHSVVLLEHLSAYQMMKIYFNISFNRCYYLWYPPKMFIKSIQYVVANWWVMWHLYAVVASLDSIRYSISNVGKADNLLIVIDMLYTCIEYWSTDPYSTYTIWWTSTGMALNNIMSQYYLCWNRPLPPNRLWTLAPYNPRYFIPWVNPLTQRKIAICLRRQWIFWQIWSC